MESKSLCLDQIVLRINTLAMLNRKEIDKTKEVILFLTKFPPVIGGVATLEYWRAYALAELGNTVLVVSNCLEDCNGYTINEFTQNFVESFRDTKTGGKVYTFFTTKAYTPNKKVKRNHQHIPFNDMSTTKLYSLARTVIEKYKPDVIYSGYLEPYAFVSFLLAEKYRIPYIVGFAGSDFNRLLSIPELNDIYLDVLKNASLVFSTWNKAERLISMGVSASRISCMAQPVILPDRFYYRKNAYRGLSVGIYGKCGKHKKLDIILKAIGTVKEVHINCMTMPANKDYLKLSIRDNCPNNTISFFSSRYPDKMYEFLNLNQIMFFFDENFDVPEHVPIAAVEAGLCGVCVAFSKTLYESMKNYGFKNNYNCIVLDTCTLYCTKKLLYDFIVNEKKYISIGFNAVDSIKKYINKNIVEFESMLKCKYDGNKEPDTYNQIFCLYIFFKYTMLIIGENNIVSLYYELKENRGLQKENLLETVYFIAKELDSLCKNNKKMTKIEREIVNIELAKIFLYHKQKIINEEIFKPKPHSETKSNKYIECFCIVKIEVESNADEILKNNLLLSINKCRRKNIYMLSKSNFEIKVMEEHEEFAQFLYEFKRLNKNSFINNEKFIIRALDEGLILEN